MLPATAVLGSAPKDWACTRGNVTGLVWEVKTDDGGLRDKDNTYSWYNPDSGSNGGIAGYRNLGRCTGGIFCDTTAYAKHVNNQKLCGKADWLLPKLAELQSLVDYSSFGPAIDAGYFPNTYWSSSPVAGSSDGAWFVSFSDGYDGWSDKYYGSYVRLVRSGQ